ncbi:MAG: hypothetical protein AAGF95_20830 [Chloroflexota bacterium]
MLSNRPPPTFEISEIVSLNALDLTVEVLEQRLELSYAWVGTQVDGECSCSPNNCQNHCGGACSSLCVFDCPTNVCVGGNCPVEPDKT